MEIKQLILLDLIKVAYKTLRNRIVMPAKQSQIKF